jgi:4-amino-4-deoxy-L-arabinose transferase-like glycosyltransferase
MPRWSVWLGISLLCGLSLVASATFAARVAAYLPHSEDEAAYLFQAQVFAQNRLVVPSPPLYDAFWSPFVLDVDGQRFAKYPPGYPMLLQFGVRAGMPWLVNSLLGAATVALVSWLAQLFYCRTGIVCYLPLLAAVLLLTTPGFLFQSSLLLSHAASLFWTTLALLALFGVTRGKSWLLPAVGACLGLVFITRPYAGLAVGLVVGVFLVVMVVQGSLRWPALLGVGAGALPLVLLVPGYWWLVAGSPTFNAYRVVWPYDRLGFGPDVGPEGYSVTDALFINTRLKLTTLARGLFGWPGWSNMLFMVIPFVAFLFSERRGAETPAAKEQPSARSPSRWDWLLLGLILSLVGLHIFYWAFGGADGGLPRYYYEALPAYVLLTARGIQLLAAWLRRWGAWLPWLLALILVLLIGINLGWTFPRLLAAQQDKYGITAASLEAVARAGLEPPVLVLVQGVDSWADFAAPFAATSPSLDGPVIYAIDWNPRYRQALRAQFPERSCWLLDGSALRPCP